MELSFGNAGPSSQANIYKSMPRSAFKIWVCWGSKSGTAWEPLAISRPSLRGPQPRDVDALACAKELWPFQILTIRMPLACSRRHLGGSEPMHRARQFSQSFLGGIFEERPAQMDMEKPPAWFHWSYLFLVNLAALSIAEDAFSVASQHSQYTSNSIGLIDIKWEFPPVDVPTAKRSGRPEPRQPLD